jgi:hypothetical protein
MRSVEIRIGPGTWTTYRVESDDQTWAYGRFHELTDKLVRDRSLYAKFWSRTLKVPKEGADDRWRVAAWEPTRDWRILAIALATTLPWLLLALAVFYAIVLGVEAASPGSNPTDKENHQIALQDVHYLGGHATALTVSILSYIIILFAYQRWLRTWLRCKVILRKRSLISQFSFRNGKSDTVGLASFYVVLFTLIVAIIALIIQ